MMETLVTFLLTGSLIQGVLCGFNINLPKRVEALKGSCVFIPCTFDIDQQYKDDLTDSAKRMWFKDGGSTAVFNSSRPKTRPLKGEIFGTATQKNCTTRIDNVRQSHNGSYYFRLEANGKLQYNYTEPTHSQVQIGVLGSPPKPTLSVFPDQQKVRKEVEVIEGSSVSLRCSTKIFCPSRPPSLTWSSSLIESITGQQYQSQTDIISDLNFTVSHRHHGVTFTCTATHQLQKQITKQESRLLSVQYAPKNTSVRINPAGLVLEGRSVTLSCSSDANPAVNYTWYRDTERPLNPVQTGPNLTINNTDPTHSGRYYCTAENKHGTQNSSVLLDVQFAPNISSSCSRSSVTKCVCEAHGNPCPTLEWRLSGHELSNSTETSISEETLGSTGVKSVLTIHQSLTDTDVLQCFSTNKLGSVRASQQFQAVPPPQDTRFHPPSLLLGAAVGASLMMIACILMLCYERRRKEKPSETREDDTSGFILTQTAVSLDNDSEFVYDNKGMLSPTAPSAHESLHYSSIDFTNADPPSGEIRGLASLTSEYAAVRHCPAENNTSTSETEPKKPDTTAKITDTSSPASEDVIYENTGHRYRQKEALVSADDAEKQD
uniref:Ig-like domain-containing protein n=1 Tax=Cyprinus carpio TaxID=7962 RepID=A0A8C1GUD9_CYPCA